MGEVYDLYKLILKALTFLCNEEVRKEYFTNLGADYTEDMMLPFEEFKKAKTYLMLLELKKSGSISAEMDNTLEKLREELTDFGPLFGCTGYTNLKNSILADIDLSEDDEYQAMKYLYLSDDTEEIDKYMAGEFLESQLKEKVQELEEEDKKDRSNRVYGLPFDTITDMVTAILPELFFTEKGYKYIPDEYKISDESLRIECYEYFQNDLLLYRYERDEEIILDDYCKLYFAVIFAKTLIYLVRNGKQSMLRRMMDIDTAYYDGEYGLSENRYLSVIKLLFEVNKIKKFDLDTIVTLPEEKVRELEILLGTNNMFSNLTAEELAIIIHAQYELEEQNRGLNGIIKNFNELCEILKRKNNSLRKVWQMRRILENS